MHKKYTLYVDKIDLGGYLNHTNNLLKIKEAIRITQTSIAEPTKPGESSYSVSQIGKYICVIKLNKSVSFMVLLDYTLNKPIWETERIALAMFKNKELVRLILICYTESLSKFTPSVDDVELSLD